MNATFGNLFRVLPLILFAKLLIYSVGFAIAAKWFPDNLNANSVDLSEEVAEHSFWVLFFAGCVLGPLLEEVAFRFIPFGIVRTIDNYTGFLSRPSGKTLLVLVLLITSFGFGIIHGGIGNVFLQGAGGLINGIVFIYWGVLNGNLGRGLAASTLVHGSWNFLTLVL